MDVPDQFKKQSLREYVDAYSRISRGAAFAMQRVTTGTATRGAITNPEGRRAPKIIEPWTQDQVDQERAIIHAVLAGDNMPVFPCRQHVDHVGEELVRVDSENALLIFDAMTLHMPATRLLREILASPSRRDAVNAVLRPGGRDLAPGNITFPTHRNSIPRTAGVKRKRAEDRHENRDEYLPRLGPADVFCIYEPLVDDATETDPDPDLDTSDTDADSDPAADPAMQESITVSKEEEALEIHAATSGGQVDSARPAELLFVKEAKAPHKLTLEVIDQAVGSGDAVLIPAQIMGGDGDGSNFWFAAVCSQLYSSMIVAGRRHGIITTGACYIFVSIDPEIPSVLRYSICKNTAPSEIHNSALIRLVAFTLLAMRDSSLPMTDELRALIRCAGLNWITGTQNPSFSTDHSPADTAMDKETPGMESYKDEDGSASSGSPPQAAVLSGPVNTDHQTQVQADHQRAANTSPPPQLLGKRQRATEKLPDLADHEALKRTKVRVAAPEVARPATPSSPPPPTSPLPASLPKFPSQPSPPPRIPVDRRAFCSPACIKALSLGESAPCPHRAEHERAGGLTVSELRQRLYAQLTGPLDGTGEWQYKFENLLPGTSEVEIIKLHLKSHGYTVIAKAFQAEDLHKMRRESVMYDRLKHLQGECVPVCLGMIELPAEKSIIRYGDFVGLLLMSWAGWGMSEWSRLGIRGVGKGGDIDRSFVRALTTEVRNALVKIHRAGVLHKDVALRNVMLQEITRRGSVSCSEFTLQVQIIDFELSRTRAMYRRRAKERLAQEGSRTVTAFDLGNAEFSKACAEELNICTGAIARWIS
ncbi:hypothetical protein DHEL01_v200834 [Diaporthe helianthi]|uniref:EKC/KEOPS complex subunit BUD32 n=1 Tax=Diaporthe helianthi TaxID=158607 RepID=A0A2P5IE36_DIAHE|nr:hypothetical protein DHEL01_v200834 [Diaporthe helianthi]